MEDCIFCKIAKDEESSHKIWEDTDHIAFLSIFPNTEGFTIVTPKQHHPSSFSKMPSDILAALTLAAQKVATILIKTFDDVGEVGMIIEGYGVNHAHIKLSPLHGTPKEGWRAIPSTEKKLMPQYEGYISSHGSERADDNQLALLAKKIRESI